MPIRSLLKWIGIIPLVALYGFISGILCLLPVKHKTKRSLVLRFASFCSSVMLALLGVRVRAHHPERFRKTGGPRLITANHLSYLDVFILSSCAPSIFITSVELRNTALLGLLARLSGSLFVERRNAAGLKKEIGEMIRVLGQGMDVAFFPEGTTSNGDQVHQFKNSLFDAAVKARVEVLPVCLRYTAVNGERLSPVNRDAVFYYGGITFLSHFGKFLKIETVDVEVIPQHAVKLRPQQSRKELAAEAHRLISEAYRG